MESQKRTIGPCKFDILFTKSVPHILEKIFLSIDYETFITSLEVSTTWRELLRSESYLGKAKSLFHGEIVRDEEKLWRAAQDCNIEEVQSLSGRFFVNVNCVKGSVLATPLCVAAKNEHRTPTNVIQLLLERGANPNIAEHDGWTPLHWAALNGNSNVMQLLLERKADPNSATSFGCTPVHMAAGKGNKDVVQLLLNRGANVNITNKRRETPLHDAAERGHKDVVQLLLNAGADPNKINNWKRTALHYAGRWGNKDVVQLLLNRGTRTKVNITLMLISFLCFLGNVVQSSHYSFFATLQSICHPLSSQHGSFIFPSLPSPSLPSKLMRNKSRLVGVCFFTQFYSGVVAFVERVSEYFTFVQPFGSDSI